LSNRAKASLCKGFALYFLRTPAPNLFVAYKKTLEHFFNLGYSSEGRPVMPPPDELPSFAQFRRLVTRIFGDPLLVGTMYQARTRPQLMAGKFSAD
jgi:hypothetical protein